ncbi:MAG: hypothetical protein ACLQU2_17200 [Candidatus Binataceae bacterium]
MTGLGELIPVVGVKAACAALNFPRASFYRSRGLGIAPASIPAPQPAPARALAAAERDAVLACLHEERFHNASPAAVYADLAGLPEELDAGYKQYEDEAKAVYQRSGF